MHSQKRKREEEEEETHVLKKQTITSKEQKEEESLDWTPENEENWLGACVVVGTRQSGKTKMVSKIVERIQRNFDVGVTLECFNENVVGFESMLRIKNLTELRETFDKIVCSNQNKTTKQLVSLPEVFFTDKCKFDVPMYKRNNQLVLVQFQFFSDVPAELYNTESSVFVLFPTYEPYIKLMHTRLHLETVCSLEFLTKLLFRPQNIHTAVVMAQT